MVAMPRRKSYTPEEYLEQERGAETKSEYEDGTIVDMAGGSFNHAAIAFNFGVAISPHLHKTGCRGVSSDARIRIDAANRYYYPDLTIVCGKPVLEERVKGMEALTNPSLIVEVLSDTTERNDRVRKWDAYQSIPSLTTYVLVDQSRPRIEIFSRKPGADVWEYRKVEGIYSHIVLPELAGITIALNAIYQGVEFQEEAIQDEVH